VIYRSICAWCLRYPRPLTVEQVRAISCSHGICPGCMARVVAEEFGQTTPETWRLWQDENGGEG
jgi:hypothetical protein